MSSKPGLRWFGCCWLFAAAAAVEGLRLSGFWLEFSLTSFDYRVLRAQRYSKNTTGKVAYAKIPRANTFPETQMTSQGHTVDPAVDPKSNV